MYVYVSVRVSVYVIGATVGTPQADNAFEMYKLMSDLDEGS
jgi:hypothetical protein